MLCSRLGTDDLLTPDPLRVEVGKHSLGMNCVAHRQDGVLIVEFELLAGAYSLEPLNVTAHFRTPLSLMDQASDIVELSRVAVTEIKRLSGFDRVMVYRFDEAWAGEVIAETVGSSPGSYLGLRFPASDIPVQARRLFLINPLRVIADVTSTPVPIVPQIGPLTGRPLGLTRSSLRSASPLHIEYLRNMGVQSSMTVSIIVQGRLWGMIACHHPVPHPMENSTRSVCELVGQMLASQVALRIDNAALQARLTSRKLLETYMTSIEGATSQADPHSLEGTRLMELLDADGLIFRIEGVVTSHGAVVEEELLIPIIGKLRNLSLRGIASSNMLRALDQSAESYASSISGALYLGLTDDGSDYLVLLRRELIETVTWAGNPDKAISADAHGALRPRTSFAAWQETVRGRSRPWSGLELENASLLREHLMRLSEAHKSHEAQERVRYLAHHDALTGLFNRHAINLLLEERVQAATADQSSFTVLFIDLDHFKYFNDRLGHAAGDQILNIVATRMQHQVRAEDIVGRLGGDEFIVIMPGLSEADAFKAAARIRRAINEPLGLSQNETLSKITASIGLSRYPVDGSSSEALLTRSDMAMYSVKHKGGNAIEFFAMDHP
jgi:diguanylate cyclase (GGDEF)-like protein